MRHSSIIIFYNSKIISPNGYSSCFTERIATLHWILIAQRNLLKQGLRPTIIVSIVIEGDVLHKGIY
ncbi:hypothetical protein [Methanobrevibacter cuticularis]|uniref:hypothetical protein n=1 Tax=Methanobrevibacter cuticularis TaxID=47311 RepID=UPI0012ED742B|nr:hypothetical protein [Methanobrevibacter cuticularis]